MGSFPTLALSLIMALFFTGLYTIEGSIFETPKITVNITNALESHSQLTIHCKSRDDDLGVHELPYTGSYAFSFRPNFVDSTLFFCSFQWTGSSHSFDVYKDMRDRERCNNSMCLWVVGEKGLCMFNYETNKPDICYVWDT